MNPISADKLDEVLGATALQPGERAVDLGCGKGELLVRLAELTGAGGLGVDRSGDLLVEARAAAEERAPRADITFVEGDAAGLPSETGVYDLAAALGATVHDTRTTVRRLRDLAVLGGQILLGEGYWRREPDPACLEALGAGRDELTTLAATVAFGEEEGLTPLYALTASEDDWDRYEWRWSVNAERYAAEHPDEEGLDELLAWIRNGRRRYLELGGRETLGFGLFLFRRDE